MKIQKRNIPLTQQQENVISERVIINRALKKFLKNKQSRKSLHILLSNKKTTSSPVCCMNQCSRISWMSLFLKNMTKKQNLFTIMSWMKMECFFGWELMEGQSLIKTPTLLETSRFFFHLYLNLLGQTSLQEENQKIAGQLIRKRVIWVWIWV